MSSIIKKENGRNGAVSTNKEKETNTEGIVEEGKTLNMLGIKSLLTVP